MSNSNQGDSIVLNNDNVESTSVEFNSGYYQLPITNSSIAKKFSTHSVQFNFRPPCQGCSWLRTEHQRQARKLAEAEEGRAAAEADRARLETEVAEIKQN